MFGKAPSEMSALQPYRGKPAVRNDRGDRGNVGIIRSPVRASILPNIRRHGALAPRAREGLNIAIIGGTNGIGRALALAALAKGAKVKVGGRTSRDAATPGLSFVAADLSSMAAARCVAQDLSASSLDILVFTNGVMAGRQRRETSEGIEYDLAVSYLSRYIILREVASTLGVARPTPARKPRVFLIGFPGTDQTGSIDDFNSERAYSLVTAHSNTVVGNEALVLDAAARYPALNAYGLNPGLIKSNIRAAVLGDRTILQTIMEAFIELTGGWHVLRDQLGGCPETARVASGM